MRKPHWKNRLEEDLVSMGLPARWKLSWRVTKPVAWFMRKLRIAEHWKDARGPARLVYIYHRVQYQRISLRLGFDIPLGVFDSGLSIAHPGTLVVNGDAKVGKNCRIHPGVTIGGTHAGAPNIGDDVFIGPNVVIVGPVQIGQGAKLFAHTFIDFDVTDGHACYPHRAISKSSSAPSWNSPESSLSLGRKQPE